MSSESLDQSGTIFSALLGLCPEAYKHSQWQSYYVLTWMQFYFLLQDRKL